MSIQYHSTVPSPSWLSPISRSSRQVSFNILLIFFYCPLVCSNIELGEDSLWVTEHDVNDEHVSYVRCRSPVSFPRYILALAHLCLRQLSGFKSRHLSKIRNERHKQRSGQHTLACQKKSKNNEAFVVVHTEVPNSSK